MSTGGAPTLHCIVPQIALRSAYVRQSGRSRGTRLHEMLDQGAVHDISVRSQVVYAVRMQLWLPIIESRVT
jgi:hypothetical protein